ncbi:Peptidoglycan-binding lysin domain [Penicillium digitatum]|uniref:LysM domain-containing protein n=3 Tax=Penicillium digitatum TaxID=36651 RepID=K9G1Y0_PEND2|nr:hypothetical protein PDIP_16060 [Penicillium digitatum Pd1]EKV16010.1 hypothetical protein PDIG_23650 [Penicillium digitatum PHI26]EKV20522.1 hypothetical protein PDIP_16060 [Penicillium digitatum Pd1]KAG0156411.1 hypothetical protein PDIDSM_3589 [Penicillium digitatum]QQK39880.1 Peptidoglycan-binding lysin domain [Penicillium digitatum]
MVPISIQSLLCIMGIASLGKSVAVETDTIQGWQLTQYCTEFYTVSNGDTCWDIIARNQNKFTMSQLLCWNDDINPWCSNLIPGRQVCVGVQRPGPTC